MVEQIKLIERHTMQISTIKVGEVICCYLQWEVSFVRDTFTSRWFVEAKLSIRFRNNATV